MTYDELTRIEILLEEGYNAAQIAVKLGRNKVSLYRCMYLHISIFPAFIGFLLNSLVTLDILKCIDCAHE